MKRVVFNHPVLGELRSITDEAGLAAILLYFVIGEFPNHLKGYKLSYDSGVKKREKAGELFARETHFSGNLDDLKIYGNVEETADRRAGGEMVYQYTPKINLTLGERCPRASSNISIQHFYEGAYTGLYNDMMGPHEMLLKLEKLLLEVFEEAKRKYDGKIKEMKTVED